MAEREKKAGATNPDAGSDINVSVTAEGRNIPLDDVASSQNSQPNEAGLTVSPSRFNQFIDSKFAIDSSPTKRKQIIDVVTTARKEIPDAIYYNAQITTLNNVVVNQNARITVYTPLTPLSNISP